MLQIEHLFPIIITSRSSNLIEELFIVYETFIMDTCNLCLSNNNKTESACFPHFFWNSALMGFSSDMLLISVKMKIQLHSCTLVCVTSRLLSILSRKKAENHLDYRISELHYVQGLEPDMCKMVLFMEIYLYGGGVSIGMTYMFRL